MGGNPSTPDEYEGEISKGEGKYNTQTTIEPLSICGPSYNKEENKRPSRGGNNYKLIRTYGSITIIMHEHNIGSGKTKECNTRQKGENARQNRTSRGKL